MKIALIEPPKFISATNHVSTVATPPLGLAYVAGTLEAAGHDVSVVDAIASGLTTYTAYGPVYLRGLTHAQVVAAIPAGIEAIGVGSMFSCQWVATRELLMQIRQRFPTVPLVLGGEHPTGLTELSLAQAPVDYVVLGEGEETIGELLGRLQAGIDTRDIPGIAYRAGGGIVINPRRGRIRHVDEIPLPAWNLFDVEAYMEHNQPHGASRGRFMPMLATRGCPYECTFCTSPNMWTQRWIARDPVLVVNEMESYIERYQASDFQFEDLTAIVRREWVQAFCQEILRRGLEISWQLPSGTRSEAIDLETCRLMKAAGCHEFAYAPESGSPRTLKIIKKRVKLERLYESARAAMDAGINVGCFFILGFPHETWHDVFHTYKAIAKCALYGFSTVNVNAFSPQPNTELYRELVEAGTIRLDDEYFWSLFTFQDLLGKKRSYSAQLGSRTLTAAILGAYVIFFSISFLRRPWRAVTTIADIFRERSSSKLGRYLRGLLADVNRAVGSRV
jgi:anaerobic magnesium-protoporphyrin IX monomethyl ester cyclase